VELNHILVLITCTHTNTSLEKKSNPTCEVDSASLPFGTNGDGRLPIDPRLLPAICSFPSFFPCCCLRSDASVGSTENVVAASWDPFGQEHMMRPDSRASNVSSWPGLHGWLAAGNRDEIDTILGHSLRPSSRVRQRARHDTGLSPPPLSLLQ
jgi:hypothetical protein